jgi:hypothetical protein
MPELSGVNAADANRTLEELGFINVNLQDASIQERLVLSRSNWFVCDSRPTPGSVIDSDSTVVLLVVKNTEACPGVSASQIDGSTESGENSGSSDNASSSGSTTSQFGPQTAEQVRMVEIIEEHKGKYDAAINDLQRGNVKVERDEAICSALASNRVSNWSGVVKKLGANSDGLGYLQISVGKNISLETWNNAFSDAFDNTLIERNTGLYSDLLSLKEGQTVRFSGEFVTSRQSCIYTKNLTEFFGVNRPEFLFRFTEVKPG